MRSDYRCVYAAIWAFCAYAAAHGQATTNGTMLADDLTSQSRVVVDAWANSSNNVTAAIGNLEFRLADGTATNGIKVFNSRYSDYAIDAENAWLASNAESLNGFTNKVDDTVTRRAFKEWTSWTFELNGVPTDDFRLEWNDSAYRLYRKSGSSWDTYGEGGSADTTTNITFDSSMPNWSGGSDVLVCSREAITTNVLGIVTYPDLEGFKAGISTNEVLNIVTNSNIGTWGFVNSDSSYYPTVEVSKVVWSNHHQENPTADISFDIRYRGTTIHVKKTQAWVSDSIDIQDFADIIHVILNGYGSTPESWYVYVEATEYQFSYTIRNGDNALGFARLSDLPTDNSQLSNGAGYVNTNDVCNIVTNEVAEWREWTFSGDVVQGVTYRVQISGNGVGDDWLGEIEIHGSNGDFGLSTIESPDLPSYSVQMEGYGGIITATRQRTMRNALGLARLSDLPPLTNGLATASITNGFITDAYIATNNPAFVSAVTNCPVAIAAGDAEALAEWGIYGGGGTIGALLAALAAAVAALKKKKMPLYPVGGSGNPVNATYDSGVLTVSPFAMASYTPTASAAFSVEMGALPSDLESGKARDAVLVIDCSSLSEGDEPTVTWGTAFHPRTDAGTDFACVAGAKNVYYISEYAPGEFAVGGWTETAGGNA